MANSPVGFYENLRLEANRESPGDWNLVADVTIEAGSLQEAIGGFSISFLEKIYDGMDIELGLIYLPYPHYNDHQLMTSLGNHGANGIGKWIKKGIETKDAALLLAGMLFLVKPVWDQVYEAFFKEKVARLLKHYRPSMGRLKDKNIALEFVQLVRDGDKRIEVRFIPEQMKLEEGLETVAILDGLKTIHEWLLTAPSERRSTVNRFVMRYDEENRFYYIDRTDHELLPPAEVSPADELPTAQQQ
jgi:hypothetical protein